MKYIKSRHLCMFSFLQVTVVSGQTETKPVALSMPLKTFLPLIQGVFSVHVCLTRVGYSHFLPRFSIKQHIPVFCRPSSAHRQKLVHSKDPENTPRKATRCMLSNAAGNAVTYIFGRVKQPLKKPCVEELSPLVQTQLCA